MSQGSATTSVLVVGDDMDTASFLESSLSTLGFEVTTAHSAMEALGELRAKNFNIILCEYIMPKMGGEELYAEMEREIPWSLRSICFLCSDPNSQGMQAFLSKTHAHVLEKPFSFDQIAGVINEILSEQST